MKTPSLKPIVRYNDRVLMESTCNAIDNIAKLLCDWEAGNWRFFAQFHKRVTECYADDRSIWRIKRVARKKSYPEIHIIIEQREPKGGK